MSKKVQILEALSDVKKVLWIFGLYHGKQLPKNIFFDMRRAVSIALPVCFPILILAKILLEKSELVMFARQLSFFILTIWVVFRVFLFIAALPKQRQLEDLLQTDVFNMRNERQDGFVYAVNQKLKYLIRWFLLLTVAIVSFFVLPPIVSNTNANIPIWTPFDGKTETIVIFIYETCCFMVAGTYYPTMDCNLIGFTSIVTAQVKTLKDNLEHVTDRDFRDDCAKYERKIRQRLKICAIHHNAILNLKRRLEDLFSSTLFCHIIFAVLQVCFFGVQLVIGTDRAEILFWLICFVTVIGQIMISCWCGQEIVTESSEISLACYMSEWYICTPSTRKMFFIIMEQAKRPIPLNGGPFFTLSFGTFVNVLRSAYSYYAVFSQVYRR